MGVSRAKQMQDGRMGVGRQTQPLIGYIAVKSLSSAILRDLLLVCTHHMLHQVSKAATSNCTFVPTKQSLSTYLSFSLYQYMFLRVCSFHLSSQSPFSGDYQTTFVLTRN